MVQKKLFDYFNKIDSTRDTTSVRIDKVGGDDLIVPLAVSSNALMKGSCRPAGSCSSNDSPVPATVKSSMSVKRKFLAKWKEEFPWLQYENGVARCSVCPRFNTLRDSSSCVAVGFTEPFRHETFKFHIISGPHIRCTEALNAQENPENTVLAMCKKCMRKYFLILKYVSTYLTTLQRIIRLSVI
jgi:hypothetical protein